MLEYLWSVIMEKKENNKKEKKNIEKSIDIEALEDQAHDIIRRIEISELENLGISEELRNNLESADENELERIEKELDLDHDKIIKESYNKQYEKENSFYKEPVEQYVEEGDLEEKTEETQMEEPVDGKCEISITEDKMMVMINLYPSKGKGKPLKIEKVKEELRSMGVVYGINNNLLERLLKNVEERKEEKIEVIIAQGTPPGQGEDGSIEFHFSETDEVLREENNKDIG